MRKFFNALLAFPGLVLLAGATVSAAVASWFMDPAYLAGSVGFLSGWLAYMWSALAGPPGERRRDRTHEANAYREALDEAVPARTVQQPSIRDHMFRREQLDRVVKLERHIVEANANTPGGISVATPAVIAEVHDLADQAYELAMRRVGLLRALRSTSEARLLWEFNAIRQRQGQVGQAAATELAALLASKQEQLDAYRRLGDELTITEAQLDSIETFLNTLSYDQSVTITTVNDQIGRLKEGIAARKQAAEEVRRLVASGT